MLRDGSVLTVARTWGRPGHRCGEFEVLLTAAPVGTDVLPAGSVVRAVAYEPLGGLPEPGEQVRLEVSALAQGLGTGGHAMVTARLSVLPDDVPAHGHLVKTRYMPDQVMVAGVDEQDTPGHRVLSAPVGELSLEGRPVLVTDLHSALPAILAGLASPAAGRAASRPRTAYVMTDGGALPAPYSRALAALSECGWLAGTVTCGQAWGGDIEAVSLHNALLAAVHVLGADVVVVIQGPGNLGTDTPWGFSGVGVGEAVNAVSTLGGRAVAALRVSQADARPRHRGISHHSLTALGRVALRGADVVVPDLSAVACPTAGTSGGDPGAPDSQDHQSQPSLVPEEMAQRVLAQAQWLAKPPSGAPHRLVRVGVVGLYEVLRHAEVTTGVHLSTMGRGLDQDPASFLAAAAAGRYVAGLLQAAGDSEVA